MNRIKAHNIFPRSLKIYDDLLLFKIRKWFNVDENTITYNHIAQVSLKNGVWFSTIQIITSGGFDNPLIPHILKKHAKKAKGIIEEKVQRTHISGPDKEEFEAREDTKLIEYEKSLSRLKELNRRGRISDNEFEKKKKKLLGNID